MSEEFKKVMGDDHDIFPPMWPNAGIKSRYAKARCGNIVIQGEDFHSFREMRDFVRKEITEDSLCKDAHAICFTFNRMFLDAFPPESVGFKLQDVFLLLAEEFPNARRITVDCNYIAIASDEQDAALTSIDLSSLPERVANVGLFMAQQDQLVNVALTGPGIERVVVDVGRQSNVRLSLADSCTCAYVHKAVTILNAQDYTDPFSSDPDSDWHVFEPRDASQTTPSAVPPSTKEQEASDGIAGTV